MNQRRRQKEWKNQIQAGTSEYENKTGRTYDYYSKINTRKIKKSRKTSYRILEVLGILFIIYSFIRVGLMFLALFF